MELKKDSRGLYSEASVLYINAVCMRRKCSVSEAIHFINQEEIANAKAKKDQSKTQATGS